MHRKWLVFPIIILVVTSCTVKWVADYRKDIETEIVAVAQKIDLYYSDLIALTQNDNAATFATDSIRKTFEKRARQIDSDLYGIYLKNKARPLNDESTQISSNILNEFWRKYKGDLSTVKVLLEEHRRRFTRNFEALLQAEKVKESTD